MGFPMRNWITAWRQAWCAHTHTMRERRDVGRVRGVLHFVCPRCGYATPAIARTPREHLAARRDGHVKRLKVAKSGHVVPLRRPA